MNTDKGRGTYILAVAVVALLVAMIEGWLSRQQRKARAST
jgi:hypothetical protein